VLEVGARLGPDTIVRLLVQAPEQCA